MNINLNLATRPYIELRSVYARLRVAAVALVVLALPMLLVIHSAETRARAAEARASQLQSNIAALRQQQARARALALEGPNANVLTQAAFLNDLFHRKAFSWTATMSDLESTLPYGVQVSTIEPLVAPDGHVIIRLRVIGAREHTVDVVRNLEHSRHFAAPRLVSEGLADQSNNGQARRVSAGVGAPGGGVNAANNDVQFDIQADYRPLPNSHDRAGVRAAAAESQEQAGSAVKNRAQLTNPETNAGAGRPAATAVRHRHAAKPAPGAAPATGVR